jgi:hypothetical protein
VKTNVGTLTQPALIDLDNWGCNPKHYRRIADTKRGERKLDGATLCETVEMAVFYLGCRGSLARYNPRDYSPGRNVQDGKDLVTRLNDCARCLKREEDCPLSRIKEVNPCGLCLKLVHNGALLTPSELMR